MRETWHIDGLPLGTSPRELARLIETWLRERGNPEVTVTSIARLYWRKVQIIDEGWQLELDDPSFKASTADPECHDEIDGRRPLAHLWHWSSSVKSKPWRACIEGMWSSNLDYSTREGAMAWTVKRACKVYGIGEHVVGDQSDPSHPVPHRRTP